MVDIYNPLINFKTFGFFCWDKKLMNILAIRGRAFYIQQWCKSLLSFIPFTKNRWTLFTHQIKKSSRKTSLRILASIIRFPGMSSFLLADVISILWTLEEGAKRFWGFNICSLSLFGRIIELTLLFTGLSFTVRYLHLMN